MSAAPSDEVATGAGPESGVKPRAATAVAPAKSFHAGFDGKQFVRRYSLHRGRKLALDGPRKGTPMGQVHSLYTTPDIAAARRFSRAIKLACDELYEDPFSRRARAALLKLIVDDSPEADASPRTP